MNNGVKNVEVSGSRESARTGLDSLFLARSIAVVGASDNPRSAGGRVLGYLKRSFTGVVLPVNPSRDTVQELDAYRSIAELPASPDLVIIAVPAKAVLEVVGECIERHVGAIVLFTSGFAETGPEGRELQNRLEQMLRGTGTLLLGPNTLGFASIREGIYATFSATVKVAPPYGTTAIVAQSGGLGGMTLEIAASQGIGLSYYCATGNEAGLTTAEVTEYLVERDDVERVVYIAEGFADPDVFRATALRARALGKTLIVCKIGDSDVGARASLSHSGAVAGDAEVHRAVLSSLGVLQAHSLDDVLDLLRLSSRGTRIQGDRLGILSVSGGAGVMLADAARARGLEVPQLSSEDQLFLSSHLPAFGNAANPIDATAEVTSRAEVFEDALAAATGIAAFDALVIGLGHMDHIGDTLVAAISAAARRAAVPIVVFWGGGDRRFKRELQALGVPTFDDPRRTIEAIAAFASIRAHGDTVDRDVLPLGKVARRLAEVRSAAGDTASYLEDETKAVLASAGIPVVEELVIRDADELPGAVEQLGLPLVAKLRNRDLIHKSDLGGVLLGLRDLTDVESAFRELTSGPHPTDGVLLQQMADVRLELACGFRRDATWGPVVVIGLGGRLLEITREVRLLAPGFSIDDAKRAVSDLAGGRLLELARGLSPDQRDRVADALVRLGALADEWSDVAELDCNPLAICADGEVRVLDAAAVRSAAG